MPISEAAQKFIDDSLALPDTWHVRESVPQAGVGPKRCVVIHPGAALRFISDRSLTIEVETLIVLEGGTLELSPANLGVKHEIIFRNTSWDDVLDPHRFGHGLLCFGTIRLHGTRKIPFYRALIPLVAGQTTLPWSALVLEGWLPGDRLVFPDSRRLTNSQRGANYRPQWEVSVLGQGTNLVAPLRFSHPGIDGLLDGLLPHVGNLTRNVVLRSEDSHGIRGRVMFFEKSNVDIEYTEFRSLGRSKIGHLDAGTENRPHEFPVEFHHLRTKPRFVGNSNWCELGGHDDGTGFVYEDDECRFKWPLVIHDTHYGTFTDNVIHNWAGAGIMLGGCNGRAMDANNQPTGPTRYWGGNETGNLVARNLIVGTRGYDNLRNNNADDGSAIWSFGWLSEISDNVIAGTGPYGIAAGIGINYFVRAGSHMVNSPDENLVFHAMDVARCSLAPCQGNEIYGCGRGFVIWYLGTSGSTTRMPDGTYGDLEYPYQPWSEVQNLKTWNCYETGVYLYPCHRVRFTNHVARNCTRGQQAGDYFVGDWEIIAPDIYCDQGIGDVMNYRNLLIQGGKIKATGQCVALQTLANPGSAVSAGRKRTRIVGTILESPGNKIGMWHTIHAGRTNLLAGDVVEVENFQGVDGDNFRVYYAQQKADYVIVQPPAGYPLPAGIAGLTNQQAWDQYSRAIAGAVAPAGAVTMSGIGGLVYREPVAPPEPVLSVTLAEPFTVTWEAARADVIIGYQVEGSGVGTLDWEIEQAPMGSLASMIGIPGRLTGINVPGAYTIRLTATAGNLTASDTTVVTVLPPVNQPPVVEAGPDQTIQWPANAVTLAGRVSDDSGLTTVEWSVEWYSHDLDYSGVTMPDWLVTSPVTMFSRPGTYKLRLTATDGTLGAFDTVTITVLPEPPPPVETVTVPKEDLRALIGRVESAEMALDGLTDKIRTWLGG